MKKEKYTLLVLDDDRDSVALILAYIDELSYLDLIGVESDPLLAMKRLKQQPVDVLLLDIEMRPMNGFQFLKSLAHPPVTIICSGHGSYAYEAFQHKATIADYISKYEAWEVFVEAIENAIARVDAGAADRLGLDDILSVPAAGNSKINILIRPHTLVHAEIMDKEMTFHGMEGSQTGRISMDKLEKMLPAHTFIRVHRSHLINIQYLKGHGHGCAKMHHREGMVPVGDNYQSRLDEAVRRSNRKSK